MFRKALAALAALSLAAQPALAQEPAKPDRGHGPITRQTLLPLGIILGLTAIVIALTLHTRNNGKKPTSP